MVKVKNVKSKKAEEEEAKKKMSRVLVHNSPVAGG